MSKVDIHKFSFSELTSNSCGKTSMSLVMAPVIILTGCTGFMWAIIEHQSEMCIHSIAVISLGVGMLVTRRFTKDKEVVNDEIKTG